MRGYSLTATLDPTRPPVLPPARPDAGRYSAMIATRDRHDATSVART